MRIFPRVVLCAAVMLAMVGCGDNPSSPIAKIFQKATPTPEPTPVPPPPKKNGDWMFDKNRGNPLEKRPDKKSGR